MISPYKTTPIFTEVTLPAALRREHQTKAGVWGVIRVLEGGLKLEFANGEVLELGPNRPGMVSPEEVHWVEPIGPMRMQVEFYDRKPGITRS